jgi:hypothetical protein
VGTRLPRRVVHAGRAGREGRLGADQDRPQRRREPLGIAEFGGKPDWKYFKYVDFVRLTVNKGDEVAATAAPSPALRTFSLSTTATVVTDEGPPPVTCPATVYLVFAAMMQGPVPQPHTYPASIHGVCTNRHTTALDASGTFDGHEFKLKAGRSSYAGTFYGSTATITSGPGNQTLTFQVTR